MRSLNPGFKLLALIAASLALSFTFNVRVNLAVCGASLVAVVLTPGVNRRRLALAMVPFLLTAAAFFTAGAFFGAGGAGDAGAAAAGVAAAGAGGGAPGAVAAGAGAGAVAGASGAAASAAAAGAGAEVSALGQRALMASDWLTGAQLSSRVLAYGGLGLLFAFTSDAFELVMSLMQQFRLPPQFAYGILAAYHFFPVVREEHATVGAALKVRGIRASPVSPKRLLPMLAHALERSESLAMAMESRGFEGSAPRRVAYPVPVRARDVVFLVCVPSAIALGLLLV